MVTLYYVHAILSTEISLTLLLLLPLGLAKVLEVHVIDALEALSNDPTVDPYVSITAFDSNGKTVTKNTSVKFNDTMPMWDEELSFGEGSWVNFKYYSINSENREALTPVRTQPIDSDFDVLDTHEFFLIYYND